MSSHLNVSSDLDVSSHLEDMSSHLDLSSPMLSLHFSVGLLCMHRLLSMR